MAPFLTVSLFTLIFITGISAIPFYPSQPQSIHVNPAPDLVRLHPGEVNNPMSHEVRTLQGITKAQQKVSVASNTPAAASTYDLMLRDMHPVTRRQRPGEILAEIARVMQDPFHDMYSFAISSSVTISLLFYIGKLIQAIANIYTHQRPQSRFDLKIGPMKASFNSPSQPLPWNSVGNIFRNLARNIDRGFIGLSKTLFRRDDIESGADITAGEQGVIFVLSMGTVLLLFYGLPDERGNFVG